MRARLGLTADASSIEAIAHDPLGIEAACRTLEPKDPAAQGGPLCAAAVKRGDPDLGKD